MPITNAGKDAILKNVFDGATLALGNMSGNEFTEISTDSSNPKYARMNIVVGTADDDKKTLYLKAENGVLTPHQDAYFNDADDSITADSLEPQEVGGWNDEISAIGVYNKGTLCYASKFTDTPIHVYQGHRVKIGKDNFQITFNPTEVAGS